MKHFFKIIIIDICFLAFTACNNQKQKEQKETTDSISIAENTMIDSTVVNKTDSVSEIKTSSNQTSSSQATAKKMKIAVYYFHGANRCVSCIAIEEVTKKTLNTYYKKELSEGIIDFKTIDIEESKNKAISEKYQVFGSSLFVTKILNGSETKTDLTGDGFKYAKNKEEKFIEILRKTITDYLK